MESIHIEDSLKELFEDLHKSDLFPDGKMIADLGCKSNPNIILENYREQSVKDDFNLEKFIDEYFEIVTHHLEFESDPNKDLDKHIKDLWPLLSRKADQIKGYSSLIPLPHAYVVPGGRFNEIYYWDSYFTMLGLQVSGKTEMIKSMIDNFAHLIQLFGFIPNGNRTYFTSRSQPPFFSLMVELLAEEKGEDVFLKYLEVLKAEHRFWMEGNQNQETDKRYVQLDKQHFLNRYFDHLTTPRVEMYSDDLELLKQSNVDKAQLMLDIRAACESGWDFSSRWFNEERNIRSVHTTDICPVDLNCLLFHLEKTISRASLLNNEQRVSHVYSNLAYKRKRAIQKFFWDEKMGYYLDFDISQRQRTSSVHAAGAFPLYFEIADEQQAKSCSELIKSSLLKDGGVVTSTVNSGQQWDAPNGWAPLQWMTIKGLRNYGYTELANEIKFRWVSLNEKVFRSTGKLMEKYNVEDIELESGGGEYPVQDGFGWTNGVLLKLISE